MITLPLFRAPRAYQVRLDRCIGVHQRSAITIAWRPAERCAEEPRNCTVRGDFDGRAATRRFCLDIVRPSGRSECGVTMVFLRFAVASRRSPIPDTLRCN